MKLRALLVSLSLFSFVLSSFAQVDVTLRVDVTNYVAGGATLEPNGLRVGGNFSTNNATNGGTAMPDWTPADAACAMTDIGMGYWEITVTFPTSSIGDTVLYKFVNGDWNPNGDNEGRDTSAIADGGCGVDDGGGNINRWLIVPSVDDTMAYCWDRCATCVTTGIEDVNSISSSSIYPNPVLDAATIELTLDEPADNLNISIYNAIGSEVAVLMNESANAGDHLITWNGKGFDGTSVQSGVYFVVIKSDYSVRSERILVAGK